ncbi:MAG TPA: transposase [Elusimicrobiales bacterium]|nr:transposase [Elusimicrobiales bacterium]
METTPQQTAVQADSAQTFISRVRRYTRRKYSAEDKIRIILEGMKREISVSELCRREGISPNIYYVWVKDFMEAGKSRLMGDNKRNATDSEVKALRRENEQLKVLLAEQVLEASAFKKSLHGSDDTGITG